jgi:peptidoglycan/LPS O-acetylase OafA/YrhL
MALKDVLMAAERIGLTDVILPFILVFTLVFAVLQKSKVLGIDKKGNPKANYNAMVAFVVAFFVLIMARTLNIITWFARYFVLLLLAFVLLGILFSLFGVSKRYKTVLMFVALVLLSFVFLEVLVIAGALDEYTAYSMIMPLMIVVYLAVAIIYWVLQQKPEEKKAGKPKAEEAPPGIEKSGVIKGK